MNLLFRIVYAAHANGTHHKLALDALRLLKNPDAERWQRLFLAHSEVYLEGSKAPDKEFKDFKNHVLHVGDNFWGGAPEKVESWYRVLVTALKNQSWHEAVYAAGIMSHYYTDPIHPFHTAQSAAENNIHRAVEWSISKSYGALAALNSAKAPPEFELGNDPAWIKDHVIAGAETSHRHYGTLIAHYNFDRGVVEPPEGLDEVCKGLIADLIAYAAAGHAALLDRAFVEAGVTPPDVNLTAETFIAALKIPVKWLTRKLEDAADKKLVEAMYDELKETGTVEKNLCEDDRQVRDMYEREVLGARQQKRQAQRIERRSASPLPQGQIPPLASSAAAPEISRMAPPDAGTHGSPQKLSPPAEPKSYEGPASQPLARLRDRIREQAAPEVVLTTNKETSLAASSSEKHLRVNLAPTDDLEAAPSIGPKTAERFSKIGIKTVAELLKADPEAAAKAIGTRHITAKTIIEWQQQAQLVCTLPGIRGGHAQLLVGAGLTSIDEIARTAPADAAAAVLKFAQTSAGQSILRDGQPPDIEKIHDWVRNAKQVLQAA